MPIRPLRLHPVRILPPRDYTPTDLRVRHLAEQMKARARGTVGPYTTTIFEVVELAGCWAGCYELTSAAQADELGAAVAAGVYDVGVACA